MKTNKSLLILCFSLIIGLNLSCEKANKKTIVTEVEASKNKKTIQERAFLSTTREAVKNEKDTYDDNLQILNDYSNINNDEIHLEIPIPNKDYRYLDKFNVSSNTISAIVYVITDKNKKAALGEPITHILEDKIPLSFIGGTVKKDSLVVFVVNDHPDDFSTNGPGIVSNLKKQIANGDKTVDCKELSFLDDKDVDDDKPKEACGGIIVR